MRITAAAMADINAHGEEGYPYEVCGFMIGSTAERRVWRTVRARNTITDRAHDRYEIDPRDHIRVQRECDADGLDIVGYYHTHPDHPARPSVFDTDRFWEGYMYVIVAVHSGRVVDAGAFWPDRTGGPYTAEQIEVEPA